MPDIESLNHSKWECKYHVVFIPKYRRKVLYEELRRHLGEVFHALAAQKESRIEEGHLQADHVHMLLSIPPKYAVAHVVGYLKGKAAIHIARTFMGRARTLSGNTSGHAGIMSPPWAGMKRPSGRTSVRRSRKIVVWIRWAYGKRSAFGRLTT